MKTKFDLNQTVFILHSGLIQKVKVTKIELILNHKNQLIETYKLDNNVSRLSENVFEDANKLTEKLLNNIN